MKAQDFVRATVAYHDELCPAAWDGDTMKGDVRERLIGIAQLFIGYLEVEGFVVEDIVLTGSLANYNWTQFSDFDLHVVTDYKNLNAGDIAEAFYRAKKTIWNDRHDITIYGHEVELYVEDINEPPVSGGVFSVLHDQWIKTPNHKNPNVNDTAVVRKVQELKDQIERCIATADDPEDLKRLTDKLSKLRRSGLDDGGEFSVENLAFKTLRNMGIIAALHKAYIEKQDDSMRLNEFAPTRAGGGFEPPKRPPVPGNRRDDDDQRPEIMPLADVAKAIMLHIGDAFTCERMRDHRGKFNPAQPGYKFVPKDKSKFGMAKIWCQGDRRGEFPVYHTSLYKYFMGSDGKVLASGQMVEKMKQKTNQNAMHTAELIYNHTAGALKQGVAEGIFDRFKKKAPEPEMTDPGNYPRGRADIDQWMTDTVEYYKVKYPESLFKLFCPSYQDYLPVRVRVGTSEQIMAQHMGTYKQLRDANPEAKKLARQRYTEYEKYPSGPSDDYTNRVA